MVRTVRRRKKRWWRKRRSVVIKQKEKPTGPEPTGGEPGRGQRVRSELESDSRVLGLTAQGTRAEAKPVRASREGPCVESRGQVSGASAPPVPVPVPWAGPGRGAREAGSGPAVPWGQLSRRRRPNVVPPSAEFQNGVLFSCRCESSRVWAKV